MSDASRIASLGLDNPQDLRSSFSYQAHQCRWRHPQSLTEVVGGQYATAKFGNNVASHKTIIHQYCRYFLVYYKLFRAKLATITEIINDTTSETTSTMSG